MFREARRLEMLPPYIFARLDRIKEEARKKGIDIINLSIGDPDLPTPDHIVQALKKASEDPENHRYPGYEGMAAFRQAVASWYLKRFDVKLDPETEVLALIGSKEGIAHFPLAFINPADIGLVPDPAYPVYKTGIIYAGGTPYPLPLSRDNNFLPDLKFIPKGVLKTAKLLFLNYPNNPTAAVAEEKFLKEAVEFARRHNLIIAYDNAYSEIAFNGYKACSFLRIPGARELGIEFHSLSKTYNMTGWRIGFACGNKDLISGLSKIKTNIDSGIFQAVQFAGIAALNGPQDCLKENVRIYEERRNILVQGLQKLGWKVEKPKATFYLWIPVLKGYDSTKMVEYLLEEAGILSTPGAGFGKFGEGYIRIALTADKERIKEAVSRIGKLKW